MLAAWGFFQRTNLPEPVQIDGKRLTVSDGDSFALGNRRFRLDGIDAPEYQQSCTDATGAQWECGKAARAALEQLLHMPGLECEAEAQDRYSRSIAKCSSAEVADIAAAQVMAGMAVSHEYFEMRDYPDEEDSARQHRRGIWRGTFVRPSEWRIAHPAKKP